MKDPDFVLQRSLNNWLYIASRNIWLNELRKKRGKEVTITETMVLYDKGTEILAHLEQAAKTKLFLEKFQLLSSKCQQLLQLYFEGKSMEVIADEMDYANSNTAKTRKYNCVQKLTKLIQSDKRYDELK